MHVDLSALPRDALARRRQVLLASLGSRTALLAAGWPRPRNYAANAFPFRPHSHFLYLFGWGAPGAVAAIGDGRATVFLPPADPDDVLWSGPATEPAALAAALGVEVVAGAASAGALAERLRGREVGTLPAPDAETRAQQSDLLGRAVVPGRLGEADQILAEGLIALRLRHDEAAVRELRAAAHATAAAHLTGMRITKPGITESAVRAAMEAELTARDCGTAYGSIVTVHGEILHNEHHGNRLEAEDLLLCDVGAETPGGWAGDVTRTWPAAGRFTPAQADLYDVVLACQRAAIAAVRPGVRYRDIHSMATELLARGLVDLGMLRGDPAERARDGTAALFFPHGVGHLLGLDVHDMEDLGDRAGYAPGRSRSTEAGLRYLRLDRDLAPGMAVTIEPGIYFVPAAIDDAGVRTRVGDRVDWSRVERYRRARGIRIEDDVLVTDTGAEVLTAAIPKDRNVIETIVGRAA